MHCRYNFLLFSKMAARDLTVWQASHRRHKHHRRPLGRPNGRPSRVDDCIGESFAFLHELIEDAFMHITPSGVDQNQHAGYALHLATHRCLTKYAPFQKLICSQHASWNEHTIIISRALRLLIIMFLKFRT